LSQFYRRWQLLYGVLFYTIEVRRGQFDRQIDCILVKNEEPLWTVVLFVDLWKNVTRSGVA